MEAESRTSESRTVATFSSKWFKYAALLLSIFLIILGAMSVYEGQLSPADDRNQNVGLIVVGVLTLMITGLFQIMLIYVAKEDQHLNYLQIYMAYAITCFGIAVGAIAIVCAVDVPNVEGRGTLLWVMGAITVVAGVMGVLVSFMYILRSYGLVARAKIN